MSLSEPVLSWVYYCRALKAAPTATASRLWKPGLCSCVLHMTVHQALPKSLLPSVLPVLLRGREGKSPFFHSRDEKISKLGPKTKSSISQLPLLTLPLPSANDKIPAQRISQLCWDWLWDGGKNLPHKWVEIISALLLFLFLLSSS